MAILVPIILLMALEKITLRRVTRLLRIRFQNSEEQNQSKDQLFSILSHDLRSAVRNLQINISRLKALLSKSRVEEAIALSGNTEQLITMIQSLLDNLLYWSLSQNNQLVYQPEVITLKPLIDQVCYDFLPLAASKNINLTDRILTANACIADKNSLKIMLRNLLDNALKYTGENGSVTVYVTQEDKFCGITIEDSGIGMDLETINTILQSDARRIGEDITGQRSTGLGLWLVKTMAAKNGGSVRISSQKGVGTKVTILLPGHGQEGNA